MTNLSSLDESYICTDEYLAYLLTRDEVHGFSNATMLELEQLILLCVESLNVKAGLDGVLDKLDRAEFLLKVSFFAWHASLVIFMVAIVFYLCSIIGLTRKRLVQQNICLFCIMLADIVMLILLVTTLLLEKDTKIGPALCRLSLFATNTVNLFTNWAWVCLWGQRFLAVFYPLQNWTSRFPRKMALLLLAILAPFFEIWIFAVVTERESFAGALSCQTKKAFKNSKWLRLLTMTEIVIGFFVPFVLVIAADLAILFRSNSVLKMIPKEQLSNGHLRVEECRVISLKVILRNRQRRHQRILRCVLVATIDAALNFPNYVYHLMMSSSNNQDQAEDFQMQSVAETVTYLLYAIQFLFMPLYALLLTHQPAQTKGRHKHLFTASWSSGDIMRRTRRENNFVEMLALSRHVSRGNSPNPPLTDRTDRTERTLVHPPLSANSSGSTRTSSALALTPTNSTTLALTPTSSNALSSKSSNALSSQSSNALSPQSSNALSPDSSNALSPESSNALSPQSNNSLSPESSNALSKVKVNQLEISSNQLNIITKSRSASALTPTNSLALPKWHYLESVM